LTRALVRHGIPTIGTGRRARLDSTDLETLKAKERAKSASVSPDPRAEAKRRIETMPILDILRRALEEARPIANDEGLSEEQRRVNLRKALKMATSAIWASHKWTG
jgi:hypothetical protein